LPGPDLSRELGTLSRFGIAGVANTAFGLATILGLELGLGVERHLANAAGYAAGALLGFVLARAFVFRGPVVEQRLKVRYVAALAAAFAINQAVLTAGAALLPDTDLGRTAAQLVALGSYTISQFALMRLWVFRRA
jgi:putative flippase GtrA